MTGTMGSIKEIMQCCRLCLDKEQVNVPIFEDQGDTKEIEQKISACLPVKISQEDQLPKKICDGCLYKLELLYEFRTTCVSAEKQLQVWIDQLNNSVSKEDEIVTVQDTPAIVKQEIDISNSLDHGDDTEYLLDHQMTYEENNIPYNESQEDNNDIGDGDATNSSDDEPLAKKRRELLEHQEQKVINSKVVEIESVTIAKMEHESDGEENVDDPEPEPTFETVGVEDEQQPGPSGLNNTSGAATTTQIPYALPDDSIITTGFECEYCVRIFLTETSFMNHYTSKTGCGVTCCVCNAAFISIEDLLEHQQMHNVDSVEPSEILLEQHGENTESVLNINDDDVDSSNGMVYILDDLSCANEVVIDETHNHDVVHKPNTSVESKSVIEMDHGYMSLQQDLNENKKRSYVATKSRQPAPKRRHKEPDWSASNYVVLTPNTDNDIVHYKCLRCEQLFINKFTFLRHIEKGKCFVNNCDVCPAVFKKNSEFYDHYITDHTDRAICNFCFRTFLYEKNVKEHMLRHLDQFRHRCDVCNKGFYTVREFRNHYKNRHMGIRHTCTVCDRSFADEYYFKRHIAQHTKNLRSETVDLNSSM